MREKPPKGDVRSPQPENGTATRRVGSLLLLRFFLLGLLLLSQPHSATAAIYACPSSDGSTVFQDRPCPREKRVVAKTTHAQQMPFGIHKSWFEIPGQADGRAFCDRRGCECGPIDRKHEGSLEQAVADALFMDTGWHHYEVSHAAWLDTPSSSSRIYEVRATMIDASCNIMMSQQLLRDFGDDVARVLRERVHQAEERGFDVAEPCDAGVPQACDYYRSVQLYRQLMADASALKISRHELAQTGKPATNQADSNEVEALELTTSE